MTEQPHPAHYTISPKKIDKYLPRLLNGEAHNLTKWLPNLIATGGQFDREAKDWRICQFKKNSPTVESAKFNVIVQRLEELRKNKLGVVEALADYKVAAEVCYEKHKQER
ncbi:MAG: hypothetical protein WC325_13045 [Candidatus Bathyarchaeia archaeon]|jgi:hypothetical protein